VVAPAEEKPVDESEAGIEATVKYANKRPSDHPDEQGRAEVEPPVADVVARRVVERLAAQLRIDAAGIGVAGVERAEWPDSCLGLAAEGEICAMMITPGFAVSLMTGDQRFDFRTDESGGRIRLASAPPVDVGGALVTWRDTRSFAMLVVGTQRVAFGRRGRPLLTAPLAVPDRAKELEVFLATYASFQARTPAGEISLAGVGPARTSAAEQRMVAEWARLVWIEGEEGLVEPTPDRAIVWSREGGSAGLCEQVVISRTGAAAAFSCRNGAESEIARLALLPEELDGIFKLIDRNEASAWERREPGADKPALDVHIMFAGDGLDPMSEGDREELEALVNGIVRRLYLSVASPQPRGAAGL
jgi:hypothetical protein